MQKAWDIRWPAILAVLVPALVCLPCNSGWSQTAAAAGPDAAPQDQSANPGGVPELSPPPADDSSRSDAAKQLEAKQRALELSRQQEANIEAGIEQLAREKNQLTDQLVTTAKQVQASEADLSGVEAKLAELTAQELALRSSLTLQRKALVKLLAALQRMGRDPPPILITERADALKMVRSAMQLATVFPQLKDKAVALAKDLTTLDATIAGIKTETAQRLVDRQTLVEEQARLDALLVQKRKDLASQQGNLGQVRETVSAEARTVAGLSELIAKSDRAVAFKGTLGDADKQLAELQPQPELAAPMISSETTVMTTAPPATPHKVVAMLTAVPGQAFERARGGLHVPVQGQRILKFGDPTKNVGRSKGEVYTTRSDAQITSPCSGLVVYAGEFRTFGQILIINAGGGYHVLLAGLGRLDASTGQAIKAGEPVGRMGAAAGSGTDPNAGTPVLYVEFRSRDKPINPAPWWSGEAEKVQG